VKECKEIYLASFAKRKERKGKLLIATKGLMGRGPNKEAFLPREHLGSVSWRSSNAL
jgi:hypothetical protein